MLAAIRSMAGEARSLVWRLEGIGAYSRLRFLLTRPETSVGYSPSADFVLPVAGVSRQHALLITNGDELEVRDLGSRNGTFVNGIRVEHLALCAGDELALGPVYLRVDRIDATETTLGLTIDSPTVGGEVMETEWQPHRFPAAGAIDLVKTLMVLLLGRGEPRLADAFRLLCEHVGADGGALGERETSGEPDILATFGDVGTNTSHPALFAFFDGVQADGARAPCARSETVNTQPRMFCCGFRRPEVSLLGLALRGETLNDQWPELGEIFLRLVDQARFRVSSPDRRRIGSDLGRLAIPMGFVRGVSARMQHVYRQLEQLRKGNFPVLVLGETGVGKEHLVRLIHDSSPRRHGPFVAINCAAIPADLLEAELFGIARGVASGVVERTGRVQQASGGTLFLDEVGEMPLPLQAKLLRALESGLVTPVGAGPVEVDIRVIAATNADLAARMSAGSFRPDLYYRLAGFELEVPPLRQRPEDVPLLLQHFLGRFCLELGKRITGVTVSALRLLAAYRWPGNVRELENEARRLVLVCPSGKAIDSTMLQSSIRDDGGVAPPPSTQEELNLEKRVAALEANLIREALVRSAGSRSGAARLLGLSRNGLAAKMSRHGIDDGAAP